MIRFIYPILVLFKELITPRFKTRRICFPLAVLISAHSVEPYLAFSQVAYDSNAKSLFTSFPGHCPRSIGHKLDGTIIVQLGGYTYPGITHYPELGNFKLCEQLYLIFANLAPESMISIKDELELKDGVLREIELLCDIIDDASTYFHVGDQRLLSELGKSVFDRRMREKEKYFSEILTSEQQSRLEQILYWHLLLYDGPLPTLIDGRIGLRLQRSRRDVESITDLAMTLYDDFASVETRILAECEDEIIDELPNFLKSEAQKIKKWGMKLGPQHLDLLRFQLEQISSAGNDATTTNLPCIMMRDLSEFLVEPLSVYEYGAFGQLRQSDMIRGGNRVSQLPDELVAKLQEIQLLFMAFLDARSDSKKPMITLDSKLIEQLTEIRTGFSNSLLEFKPEWNDGRRESPQNREILIDQRNQFLLNLANETQQKLHSLLPKSSLLEFDTLILGLKIQSNGILRIWFHEVSQSAEQRRRLVEFAKRQLSKIDEEALDIETRIFEQVFRKFGNHQAEIERLIGARPKSVTPQISRMRLQLLYVPISLSQ